MTEIHRVQEPESPAGSSVRGDQGLKTYTVYRFDYIRQVSEPVGKVVERRSKDRGNNVGSLLKLAHKTYPTSSLDSRLIITPD